MGNANLVPYFWVVRYTHGPTAFPSQSFGLPADMHGNRVSEKKLKISRHSLSFSQPFMQLWLLGSWWSTKRLDVEGSAFRLQNVRTPTFHVVMRLMLFPMSRAITTSPNNTINNGLCFSRVRDEIRLIVSNNDASIRIFTVPHLRLLQTLEFSVAVNHSKWGG